jgi:hypothetical protein
MRVRIRLILLCVGICLAFTSNAQNLKTTIKVQAMDMGSAFMKNDFATFSKYIHPSIIAYAGGKGRMKTAMDSAYVMMQQFGARFKRYAIGEPGPIVTYNNQLQAVVPISTTVTSLLGDLIAESSMIVISPDKGKNWWFIDTNIYNADKLKKIMPDISPKLVIPPPKRPKFVAAGEEH